VSASARGRPIVIAALFAASLVVAGCGGSSTADTPPDEQKQPPPPPPPPPPTGQASGSLQFYENMPRADDYARITDLPVSFGVGEFTFEMWVRLDASLPVGPAGGTSTRNWSSADPAPYSSPQWWYAGNFLVDGHNNADFSSGTFSFQVIGGGRIRWLFGDGSAVTGGVLAVQAVPSSSTASLLDGQWHHIAAVRRWQGSTEARLELWIDGQLIATETSSRRTNMSTWWATWSAFPSDQPGWLIGAEKFSANGGAYWDDYKGGITEVRFFDRARTPGDLQLNWRQRPAPGTPGLVGSFRMVQPSNSLTCDDVLASRCFRVFPQSQPIWSPVNPLGQ